MMTPRTWWLVIAALAAVIILLAGFLYIIPLSKTPPLYTSPAAPPASSSQKKAQTSVAPTDTTSPAPLSSKVMVTTPLSHGHVGHSFTVAGVAPSPWFFEAQFPVQVRDLNGNVVGRVPAHAQGNWQTDNLVTFTALMPIDATFHGAANLILLKDNPSGLPENDDAVTIPIIVD